MNGCLVTGPNGNSIFLPASGGFSEKLYYDGQCGYLWSRTLCSREKLALEAAGQDDGYILFYDDGEIGEWYDYRSDGLSVRAVIASR